MALDITYLGIIDKFTYSPNYKKNNKVFTCEGARVGTYKNSNYLELYISDFHPVYARGEIFVRSGEEINSDLIMPYDLKFDLSSNRGANWRLLMLEGKIQNLDKMETGTELFSHKINYIFAQELAKQLIESSLEIPILFEERLMALVDDVNLDLFIGAKQDKKFKSRIYD